MLSRAVQDEVFYQHLYKKVYAVQLKQIGHKLHFDIERIKNQGKKKEYEYVMIAKYQGESEGLVTCRVSNAIMQSHFSVPAVRLVFSVSTFETKSHP